MKTVAISHGITARDSARGERFDFLEVGIQWRQLGWETSPGVKGAAAPALCSYDPVCRSVGDQSDRLYNTSSTSYLVLVILVCKSFGKGVGVSYYGRFPIACGIVMEVCQSYSFKAKHSSFPKTADG